MKISPPHHIFKSMTLRMFVPVVLVICAVGLGLYIFVLRAVSEFAEQEIRESLTRTAKEVYGICDKNFTELLQSGRMNNSKAVRIRRALTLGAIEDYAKRHKLILLLHERGGREVLSYNADQTMRAEIARMHHLGGKGSFRFNDKRFYFYHFDFKPWSWHFEIANDTTFYAPLVNRVKRFYTVTAAVLLLGLALLLVVLERALRSPVQRIITAVREKRPPDYQGIQEFEFLSSNIAGMMASLKERTAWLEQLYIVGSSKRGENFFRPIARVMADAMTLCTVITQKDPSEDRFRIMAFAEADGITLNREQLEDVLPCASIADRSEPTVYLHQAAKQLSSLKGIIATDAETYVGLPIFDREDRTIGCIHLFGAARGIDDWDMNFVKTAGQMVALEFELIGKEQEQDRIREQMFQAQKLESLGLLAGGVAHDFNNLLMGIQGRASLLRYEKDIPQVLHRQIEAIEEYVRSAADLTRQLLGFARGGKYDVKPADLNALLDHCAKMFGRTKKEIVITKDFAPALWPVEIDGRQIEQVFLNLFVNAWHAMPTGGKMMLKTENVVLNETHLKTHQVRPGRYVKAAVSDTGVGMDEATMKKIFDPFFTTREMKRGTGLGLASAYGIIKNHEGLIDVSSEIGRGTSFHIYLPASDKRVAQETTVEVPLLTGDETVLLVDDEKMIIEVGEQMLEKLGYRVMVAQSGRQAVDLFREHHDEIQLVILDMIMPEMSGGETFDHLREIQGGAKVLLSSGYSMDAQAQAILNRGCEGFIQKPFKMADLSRQIRQILDNGN